MSIININYAIMEVYLGELEREQTERRPDKLKS